MNDIVLETGEYGVKAIIKSEWHDHFIHLMIQEGVKELELNYAKGWHSKNLNFLESLTFLKSFIYCAHRVESLEPIHYLVNVENLHIQSYRQTPINFEKFPNLKKCGFEWIPGSDSLFECKGLIRLFLNSYKKKDSAVFSNLINLEDLSVLNAPLENIDGILKLSKLQRLRIANLRKVSSLDGISALSQLIDLDINTCKAITSVTEVFKLKKLKRLCLNNMGEIDSIVGIENLEQLEEFICYESTNIKDGNLSPLSFLENISRMAFKSRKHYTHKSEDFKL